MTERKTVFGRETLDTIGSLYAISKPYAEMVGIDPFLAIGGPAEEFDSINSSLFQLQGNGFFDNWAGGLPEWVPVPDWTGNLMEYSHERIKQDIADGKGIDRSRGVSVWNKFWHPTLVDLGIGNIKLGTAIDLLDGYNQKYPNTDPLDLKKYNDAYNELAYDLTMNSPLNATAKFAVLEAVEAIDFFKRRAPRTWGNADQFERLGLVATYYNRGREKMEQVAKDAEKQFGEYRPIPGFGGEKAAENGWALAIATGRGPRSLGAGRAADRASVPGYGGDRGRRRDNQDSALYGEWRADGRHEEDFPKPVRMSMSSVAGRRYETAQEVPIGRGSSARLPGESAPIPIGTETNALDVLGDSGLLRRFPTSRMPRTEPGDRSGSQRRRRGYERRSQAAPEVEPGGLLGPAATRFAGMRGAVPGGGGNAGARANLDGRVRYADGPNALPGLRGMSSPSAGGAQALLVPNRDGVFENVVPALLWGGLPGLLGPGLRRIGGLLDEHHFG